MKKALSFGLLTALTLLFIFPVLPTLGSVETNNCWLNLPPDPVTMMLYDGTNSYFDTTLSNVPPGYDVTNATYLGWCVDRRYIIPRGPATHEVMLYSSCNPPMDLEDEEWDMVNYILNHKQGTMMDIQEAIWYFINMVNGYTPSTPAGWAMVYDAQENGTDFVPGPGEVVAVICYPEEQTQITIIELRKPLITELVVGRKWMPVGNVTVWNDNDYLYVRYSTAGCWYLAETHLAVATSLEGIPQTKKGNPIPGKFPYMETHDWGTTEYTYEIPLNGWKGMTLYIAAHAEVHCDGCFETAWGEGPTAHDFPGRNWALYFTYTVCDP